MSIHKFVRLATLARTWRCSACGLLSSERDGVNVYTRIGLSGRVEHPDKEPGVCQERPPAKFSRTDTDEVWNLVMNDKRKGCLCVYCR